MKKFLTVLIVLGSLVVISELAKMGNANYETANEINKGIQVESYQISVNSTTPVVLASAKGKRVDLSVLNNSAFDLYIGSATTLSSTNGFLVPSKRHYSPDGLFVGVWYAIMQPTSGSQTIYTLEYIRN